MSWSDFSPCLNEGNGEVISGTLKLHFVNHFDKNGYLTKWHAQPQGSFLVGQTTGIVYRATGVTQEMLGKSNGNGADTYQWINRYHMVGQGVQWFVKQTMSVTINANGVVTADFNKSESECK